MRLRDDTGRWIGLLPLWDEREAYARDLSVVAVLGSFVTYCSFLHESFDRSISNCRERLASRAVSSAMRWGRRGRNHQSKLLTTFQCGGIDVGDGVSLPRLLTEDAANMIEVDQLR